MQQHLLIWDALAEDMIDGRDMTSDLFIPAATQGAGWIEAREDLVVSGLTAAREVFLKVDADLRVELLVRDGARVDRLERVLTVSGRAGSILKAERTALNFLGHLSGIATHTSRFVDATSTWNTTILCTRKTTPGLRDLEVQAVRDGGGDAYRTNLTDSVLIKDNHLGINGGMAGIAVRLTELKTRDAALADRVLRQGKIEAGSLSELEQAVSMGWKQILLDNFSTADAATAARRYGDKVFLEISGGVNLGNVASYAETGVHAISIGAVTHSSRAADFSLEVEWRQS